MNNLQTNASANARLTYFHVFGHGNWKFEEKYQNCNIKFKKRNYFNGKMSMIELLEDNELYKQN